MTSTKRDDFPQATVEPSHQLLGPANTGDFAHMASGFADGSFRRTAPLSLTPRGLEVNERVAYLMSLAEDPPLLLPAATFVTPALAEEIFSHLRQWAEYAEETCRQLGIDVDATVDIAGEIVPVFDFGVPHYADVIVGEAGMRARIRTVAPDLSAVMPNTVAAVGDDSLAADILAKLLYLLGLSDLYKGLLEFLDELDAWQAFVNAMKSKNYKTAGAALKQVLSHVTSKAGARALAAKVGEKAAAKAVGKLLAKALPLIGWAILIGEILAGLIVQWIAGICPPPDRKKGALAPAVRPAVAPPVGGSHSAAPVTRQAQSL